MHVEKSEESSVTKRKDAGASYIRLTCILSFTIENETEENVSKTMP